MTASDGWLSRQSDLIYLLEQARDAQCVSVVGISNVGKSHFARTFCRDDVRSDLHAPPLTCFYIDCNSMLAHTEHAFYELTLRVILDGLSPDDPLLPELQEAYDGLLNPPGEFHVPLNFNRALTILIERNHGVCVLLFDEFDAPFQRLDPHIFLNLRALKDRYGPALSLITVTDRPLTQLRSGDPIDEFSELFSLETYYLRPLTRADTAHLVLERAAGLGATFDEYDLAFVYELAGGHPSLVDMVCRQLAPVTGTATRSASENLIIHREMRGRLRDDSGVRAECGKIWRNLGENEQDALRNFRQAGAMEKRVADGLLRKGILVNDASEVQSFATLFSDFVSVQTASTQDPASGVRVDARSGEITVDGRLIDELTNLEYRLLLLLYGHLNQICDKYSIVEAVWGEDYVDQVYDASIEKLISRLRRKIEPDIANPRYLITVRGRGYKLVG